MCQCVSIALFVFSIFPFASVLVFDYHRMALSSSSSSTVVGRRILKMIKRNGFAFFSSLKRNDDFAQRETEYFMNLKYARNHLPLNGPCAASERKTAFEWSERLCHVIIMVCAFNLQNLTRTKSGSADKCSDEEEEVVSECIFHIAYGRASTWWHMWVIFPSAHHPRHRGHH